MYSVQNVHVKLGTGLKGTRFGEAGWRYGGGGGGGEGGWGGGSGGSIGYALVYISHTPSVLCLGKFILYRMSVLN